MRVQPAVVATVAIVVVTTLASGPLVGLDLTAEHSFSGEGLGEGRATVGDVTMPDRVAFERADFGAGSYYLRVPSATVELSEVVGRPILNYEVSIDELGYTRSTIKVLSSANEGTLELGLDEVAFGRDELEQDSYAGELSVSVRYEGTEHVVATKNVTVEVVE